MADLIDRYVYDVVRRLPEKDRQDVKRELAANIYDALPENPRNEEVEEVLTKLGSPQKLANEYRQKPYYLISPALYGSYIRTLKWVVPLAGGVLFALGMIIGAFESLERGTLDAASLVSDVFAKAFSLGFTGIIYALFWTTVGFAIAERAGFARDAYGESWSVDMLPEVSEETRGAIPLSDSIAELVLVVVFSVLAVLFMGGIIPVTVLLDDGVYRTSSLFASSFKALFIFVIIAGCMVQAAEYIIKIVQRRWTLLVCGAQLVGNTIGIALLVLLAMHSEVLSVEFTSFIEAQAWWSNIEPIVNMASFGANFGHICVIALVTAIIVGILIDSAVAIYKTGKARRLARE